MRQTITQFSRNLVLSTFLTLALLPARVLAQEDLSLPIDQVRPGQTHIGRAIIQNIVEKNAAKTAEYNADPKNQQKQRTPLQNYQAKMDAGDRLPVVKAPDGGYILLDGHHRTTSFASVFEAARKQWDLGNDKPGEPRPEVPSIKVAVEQDYTSKSWEEFAKYMVDNHKIYFDKDLMAQARKKFGDTSSSDDDFTLRHFSYLYRTYLPKSVEGLRDSPMRSVVGTVLYNMSGALDLLQDQGRLGDTPEEREARKKKKNRLQLDGAFQAEYIEFLIGDRLKKEGILKTIETYLKSQSVKPPILKGNEYNPGVLKIVEDSIFGDQAEFEYLRDSCRKGTDKKCLPKDTDPLNPKSDMTFAAVNAAYKYIYNVKQATTLDSQPKANPADTTQPKPINPPAVNIQRQIQRAAPVR